MELGQGASTLEARGLTGSWGPAEGDFESGEDTEKLVSNVLEGNGDLLGGVWAQVCYAAYRSRVVCDDYNVIWDGSVASLPFD